MNPNFQIYLKNNYQKLYNYSIAPYNKKKINSNSITVEDLFQEKMIKCCEYCAENNIDSLEDITNYFNKKMRYVSLKIYSKHLPQINEEITIDPSTIDDDFDVENYIKENYSGTSIIIN